MASFEQQVETTIKNVLERDQVLFDVVKAALEKAFVEEGGILKTRIEAIVGAYIARILTEREAKE